MILAVLLIVLGVAMRLLPHLPNFTPIAAMSLFGGVYLDKKYALILPLAALFISDVFIGFDSLESRLSVYSAFILVGLVGLAVRRRKTVLTIILGSLSGSVIFYLITNFAYFYHSSMYPHNLSGVLASYYNAIPFFRYTLLGDLVYTGLLFGAYEAAILLARRRALKYAK